ncbi:MAG: sensor histidine kinase [Erysipelotrichaceae bacterium]
MESKLRKRFVLIGTASFAFVMISIIIFINVSSLINNVNGQNEMLENIMEYDKAIYNEKLKLPINEMPWAGSSHSEFTAHFFIVHSTGSGEIALFDSDFINSVDFERAQEYVKSVLSKNKKSGTVGDYRYLVSYDEEITIVFLNIVDSLKFQKALFVNSLLIGSGGLLMVVIILFLVSKRAIKPFVDNVNKQKRFITDASHELKTPLTSISTSVDILKMESDDNEWLDNIQSQVLRLTKLVNSLVILSKSDEGKTLNECFDLSELVYELLEPFEAQSKVLNIKFIITVKEKIMVNTSKDDMRQLVSILLDNAFKYSKSLIKFNVYELREKVCIDVYNDCEYFDMADKDRIFDRFYRGKGARDSLTGGNGVGLSIVKNIADNHKWKLSVYSSGHDFGIKVIF